MGNTTNFQLILSIILGIIAILAVLMFAGMIPGGATFKGTASVPSIVLWGPYSGDTLGKYIQDLNAANKQLVQIAYESIAPERYLDDLIEAFARGTGPDLFFADQDMLNRLRGKIADIPYEIYPARNFINDFVDGSSVMTTASTIRIMPLMVDPLVMYYDRSAFTSAGIVVPPKTWDDFMKVIPELTERDERGNFKRTAAAMGEFRNIRNAKYLYSTLTLQAGNPITKSTDDGAYNFILGDNLGYQPAPAEAALNFYLQFSNPSLQTYVWNRSMDQDQDMFAGGKSYTYFGFASELPELKAKNPHLDIDILAVPQKDLTRRVTYGRFIGVAVAGNSSKKSGAYIAALVMAQSANLKTLSEIISLPPTKRDLLSNGNSDPLIQALYNSAVLAHSWVDPDRAQSQEILQTMMENVQTGQIGASLAITGAAGSVNLLYLR